MPAIARPIVAVLTAVLLCLMAVPPAAATSNRVLARRAYARGQERFADGDYEAAKTAFEEAFEAVPNPIVLRSIAECDLQLGDLAAAIEGYRRYLDADPDADDRVAVKARLRELRATPAVLIVGSRPEGAEVVVDGEPTGVQTPGEVTVEPGEHTVLLGLSGYQPIEQVLYAAPGERVELGMAQLKVERPATSPDVAAAPPPATLDTAAEFEAGPDYEFPADAPGASPALWVTGAIGVVGLAAGGVFGAMALSRNADFDETPTTRAADDGERFALLSDVSFGVAAVSIVTWTILLLVDSDDEADDAFARRGTGAPRLAAAPGGVGAQLQF